MNPIFALPLTLIFPEIPWLALSPWWVAKEKSAQALTVLFLAGLLVDFWWGRPLGGLSLLLISLSGVTAWVERRWPGDRRTFVIFVVALSALSIIIYWSR